MDYNALGEKIREQRLRLNMTQEKMAEKAGISESFMGHIERGDRKLSLETLVKISSAFNVSIDYLLLDSTQPEPDRYLAEVVRMLENKDKQQVKTLLNLLKVLVENIDEWTE